MEWPCLFKCSTCLFSIHSLIPNGSANTIFMNLIVLSCYMVYFDWPKVKNVFFLWKDVTFYFLYFDNDSFYLLVRRGKNLIFNFPF